MCGYRGDKMHKRESAFKEIERIACACTYRVCPVYSFRFKRRPENLIGTLLHTHSIPISDRDVAEKKGNSVLYLYNTHIHTTHIHIPSALSFHIMLLDLYLPDLHSIFTSKRYTIIYTVTNCIIFYIYKYVNVFLTYVSFLDHFLHPSSFSSLINV